MKAVKSLWQNSIESVSRITDRVREAFAPKQVVSPAHAQSGRLSVWDPAMYRSQVDDSRLYRDSSRRSEDSVPSERLLVKTSGTSVGLRNRGYGSQDRYLTIVAEVAEYEVKQGLSGTVTAGGLPQVENKQQLKPLLARGLAYDQGEFERMARSNPVARNAIRATVERVAQASEYYCAPDIDWEALVYQPGITPSGRAVLASKVRESTERAAEVLNLEWYHNPDVDPSQVIREQAYAMVPGFVLHEFGIDSRLQGRRRTTFVEHRAQSSVLRWLWDQSERWCGVVQNASGSPGLLADIPVTGVTVQGMPVIDSRKLLLVTNQRVGLNLEGLSDLRASWYASQGKTEWFVSALMHRRKWGNGFPVFRLDADSAKAKGVSDSIASAAKDFFYSGQAYMGLPPGVTMEMLEFDSDTGFIAAMEYFDKEILRSLGALATEIGQSGGSYNLMEVQQQERLRQLEGYAQQIKSSRKSWIEAACSILIGDLAVLPELKIEGIMTRSDTEVLTIWEKVAAIRNMTRPDGLPVYTDNDIRTLCDTVGVPFSTEEEVREAEASKRVVEQVSDEGISVAQEQVANDQVEQGIDQSANVLEGETEKPTAPLPAVGAVKKRQSVKKKKVLPVTVIGRDGAKFATYRELLPIEKCVAWASLYLLTDSETTDTARAVNKRMKEHALEYAELASPYIKKGAMPPDTIANKFKPEVYEAIISTRLTQWADITSKQMKTEIRSQVGSQFLPEADDKLFGAELKNIVAANAATLAKRLNDDLNARLMAAASQSALGSRSVAEVVAMPLAKETYKKWTLATVNIVNNFVREETARLYGPPIKEVTYSAIMDQDTCPECARLDGTTYFYGSPPYIANRPPNQKCLSKLGPYGNVCRCIYVYAFKDKTGSAGGSIIEQ